MSINHDGWLLDRTSPEKHVEYLLRTGREGLFTKSFTFFINEGTLRTENDNRRVLLKGFELRLKSFR